jgi:hypothetical protein
MEKNGSGSGINILVHCSESLETVLWLKIRKNFFDADPNPGSGIFLIPDPGWKNSDPGSRIRYKHPGSATLPLIMGIKLLS